MSRIIAPQWVNRKKRGEGRERRRAQRLARGWRPSVLEGCVGWFDADHIAGSDGASVGTWEDASGEGNDATQGTSSKQPTLKTGLVNGHNAVRFDGTDDTLTLSALGAIWNDGVSVFAVLQTSSDHNGIYWSLDDGSGNRIGQWKKKSGGHFQLLSLTSGQVDGTSQSNNTFLLVEGHWGPQGVLDINGTEDANGNIGWTKDENPPPAIGTQSGNTTNPFDGDIASLVVFRRRLTGTEETRVRAYLNTRYDLF